MAIREVMKVIASENNRLSVNEVNKIALSVFDIKRFHDDDGISSLAFGPYKRNQTRTVFEKTGKILSFTNDIVDGTDEKIYGDTQNNHPDQSCENEESFRSPDPGSIRNAEGSSDNEDIIDWGAPVVEKTFNNSSVILFEAE